MKIVSIDNKSSLKLDKREDEFGYSAYSIEGNIDIGHSNFHGCNNDLQILNFSQFIESLDLFITDRSIQPKLEGTYGSYILIKGTATQTILSFKIGSVVCVADNFDYSLQGSFEFPQENLNAIIRDLKNSA